MQGDKEEIEFAHPYFLRGQEHLLDQIKRKVSMGTRPAHFMPNIKSDKVTDDNAVKLFTHYNIVGFISVAEPHNFLRLRPRVKILMRLRLLPCYIADQNFKKE
jgi:hypothetical protein